MRGQGRISPLKITPYLFATTWESEETCAAAAKKLKMTPHQASSRANFYRAKGVKLKTMPGKPKVEVESINAAIGK